MTGIVCCCVLLWFVREYGKGGGEGLPYFSPGDACKGVIV